MLLRLELIHQYIRQSKEHKKKQNQNALPRTSLKVKGSQVPTLQLITTTRILSYEGYVGAVTGTLESDDLQLFFNLSIFKCDFYL